MSTISVAFGDEYMATYDGSGAATGLKKHYFPRFVLDADFDYSVAYTLAETFVNNALAGATKIIVMKGDGFGTLSAEGDKLLEPTPVSSFKGFCGVTDGFLLDLIKLHIQKKVNSIKGLVFTTNSAYTRWYCPKCAVLNGKVTPIMGNNLAVETDVCKHRNETTLMKAYATWHSFVAP